MDDSDHENSVGSFPDFNYNRPRPDRPRLDRPYPGRYSPVTINKNKPIEPSSMMCPSPFNLSPGFPAMNSPMGEVDTQQIPESYWLTQLRYILKIAAISVLVCYLVYFGFLMHRRWFEESCIYRIDTKVKLEQAVRASTAYPQGHMVSDGDWLSHLFVSRGV